MPTLESNTSRLPMASATREQMRLSQFRAACEAALARLGDGPVFGLDLAKVCGTAKRVKFTDLDMDDKVRVTPDAVLVHAECPERLARGRRDPESAAQLAVLYFVHELAHLPQGIGAYPTVRGLRAVDEHTLLHLDLAADHAAAIALMRVSALSLAEVKHLQAASLCGFPAGPSHSPAARLRKARRAVSLCADALLCIEDGSADRFVVASFLPGETGLALHTHGGGATCLVRYGNLDGNEVSRLAAAADAASHDGARAAEVSEILRRVIEDVSPARTAG